MNFKYFIESTLNDLHQSAVTAFPLTKKRQHVVDSIKIAQLEWIPYLGLNTLFVKGLAENIKNGNQYKPIILFKKVNYQEIPNEKTVNITTFDDKKYFVNPFYENEVLVRCNCEDFSYRFNFYDHLDKSLFGKKRSKYESKGGMPANPKKMPGMCKHIMALKENLKAHTLRS